MFAEKFLMEKQLLSRDAKPYIVAEIGLNHNNDPETGKKTIAAAKKAGADAVKFQSYITEEFIDKSNPDAGFLFDIFKKYELSEKDHRLYQQTAKDEGLAFFSTPLCTTSLDLLVSLNVPAIKIASGDIVNAELLKKAAETGLPLFVSTGASDISEVHRALDFLQENKAREVCLMHCVSLYPTKPSELKLATIPEFLKLTNGPVGFSDHSGGYEGLIAAIILGATVFEKHFTLGKNLDGPDHSISADPQEFREYCNKAQITLDMLGSSRNEPLADELKGRFFGRRSLYMSHTGKVLPMRPDLSIENRDIASAWDITTPENLFTEIPLHGNIPVKLKSK